MCNKIKVIVNDLKKAQGTEVAFANIVVSEETKEEIKKAKLKGHGIIAKDKDGKLVQILSGHSYDDKAVKAIVAKLLAKEQPAEDKVEVITPSLTYYYIDQ
ncbi:MAG: hypothetical protein ACI9SQ_000662 [Rubritalea sp.]|jgi:hypothetical protein